MVENSDPYQIYVRQLSYYLNVADPLINSLICVSLCYREKVHDNREFSRGNSKPHRESQMTTR